MPLGHRRRPRERAVANLLEHLEKASHEPRRVHVAPVHERRHVRRVELDSIDTAGNLYLTTVESTAVGVIPADGRRYREFAAHPELVWPDGVSYAPDGYLYVSPAQVSRAAGFNGGEDRNEAPYFIFRFRFRPLAPGRLGY